MAASGQVLDESLGVVETQELRAELTAQNEALREALVDASRLRAENEALRKALIGAASRLLERSGRKQNFNGGREVAPRRDARFRLWRFGALLG